jgi:hypothetical protein
MRQKREIMDKIEVEESGRGRGGRQGGKREIGSGFTWFYIIMVHREVSSGRLTKNRQELALRNELFVVFHHLIITHWDVMIQSNIFVNSK